MNVNEWPTGTFANEDHLPRVPLPSVSASCRRLLEWCAPLLSADQLTETEAAVAAFQAPGGPAHTLHAELAGFDATPGVHSWLDRFWPARYLGRRDRIALNANFFFLFNDAPGLGQVERAAGLIAGAVAYKQRLDRGELAPTLQRGRPMSMVQQRFLFSTTRIPGERQDGVRAPYGDEWPGPSPFRHVVVSHRGHMMRMDVVAPDGRPYALDDLAAGLRAAMAASAEPAAPGTTVGSLTTKARAEWAASRARLAALSPANREALDTIETALFCVCLDDVAPSGTREACDHLLHGDSRNRWFDKSVSLVVFADGRAGINDEHCGLDGTTVVGFVDSLLTASPEEHAAAAGAVAQGAPPVAPVTFVLDDEARADVEAAAQAFADYAAATATATLSFDGFGSDRVKALRMSPDGFAQMAFQLAHRRSKGFLGATYESISTRHFRHGRTEAMRVVTPEALAFVEAMDDPGPEPAKRAELFRAAAAKHVARAKECQQGDAPEQHLWELLMIQQRAGDELGVSEAPALYGSPGWRVMRDDYLSTSAVPSVNVQYFGFGSTSPTCIGVAYVLLPEGLNVYLCTPRAVAPEMQRFEDELVRAFVELEALAAAEPA